jgi:hypothetical protein
MRHMRHMRHPAATPREILRCAQNDRKKRRRKKDPPFAKNKSAKGGPPVSPHTQERRVGHPRERAGLKTGATSLRNRKKNPHPCKKHKDAVPGHSQLAE